MEEPKRMISTIVETSTGIIILTPKRKSWVLIIFLSIITLQFTNGIVQSLFFTDDLPLVGRIAIFTLSSFIAYFSFKELMWQSKGVQEININNDELKLSKLSPIGSKTKTYRLSEVKTIDVKHESVSEGPMAMLQLLRITDKTKITFSYGYSTVIATSGIDLTEALELKNLIKNKIESN